MNAKIAVRWSAARAISRLGLLGQLGALVVLGAVSAEAQMHPPAYAYVTIPQPPSISLVEVETDTVVWAQPLRCSPRDAAVAPNTLYVLVPTDCDLVFIDTMQDRILRSLEFGDGVHVSAAAFSPTDEAITYATIYDSSDAGSLLVLDGSLVSWAVPVEKHPSSMAVSPDGTLAYVASSASNSISVIDLTTGPPTVIDEIALGSLIPGPVTFAPDGSFAYVPSNTDAGGILLEINTVTGQLVDPPIDLGRTFLVPTRAAFNADGSRAFVGVARNDSDPQPGLWLEAVNPSERRVVDFANLGGLGFFANSVAVSRDFGQKIYVTGGNLLSDSDNVMWDVWGDLRGGSRMWFPRGFNAFPDAVAIARLPRPEIPRIASVANSDSDFISVINTDTDQATSIPFTGDGTELVSISADGKFAYAVFKTASLFIKIRTSDLSISSGLWLTQGVWIGRGIAIAQPDGRFAVVSGLDDEEPRPSIYMVNTQTMERVSAVDVSGEPQGLAITPDGKFAYVAVNGPDKVVVIDLRPLYLEEHPTLDIIATIPAVPEAQGVAITPDGRFAFVTATHRVVVIDAHNNTVVDTIAGNFQSVPLTGGIAITPNGRVAYVTTDHSLALIDVASHDITRTIGMSGNQCSAVAINRLGVRVYVPCVDGGNGVVNVVATAFPVLVDLVPVGRNPRGVAAR